MARQSQGYRGEGAARRVALRITAEVVDGCREYRHESMDVLNECSTAYVSHFASMRGIHDSGAIESLTGEVAEMACAFLKEQDAAPTPDAARKAIRRFANRLTQRDRRHAGRELLDRRTPSAVREGVEPENLGDISGHPSLDPLPFETVSFREQGTRVCAFWQASIRRLEGAHSRYAKICADAWRIERSFHRSLRVSDDARNRAIAALHQVMLRVCEERIAAGRAEDDDGMYVKLHEFLVKPNVAGSTEFARFLERLLAFIEEAGADPNIHIDG